MQQSLLVSLHKLLGLSASFLLLAVWLGAQSLLGNISERSAAASQPTTYEHISPGIPADKATPQATPTINCAPGWQMVPGPSTFNESRTFQAVSAITPNDIWAVGTSDVYPERIETFTAHWDGSTWSTVPSPNVGANDDFLTGVDAIASNDVWAVGGYLDCGAGCPFQNFTMHWDGTRWNYIPSPNVGTLDNTLYSVSAISANEVWAVGYYRIPNGTYQTLTMRWDGSAWSYIPSPNIGSAHNYLYGVSAISSSDIWAVGYTVRSGVLEALALRWNGQEWSIVSVPRPGIGQRLYAVAALSTNNVWAVGSYNEGSGSIGFAIHWDGAQWTHVPTPSTYTRTIFRAVAASSSTNVWAVGEGMNENGAGVTFTMRWNGSQWSHVLSPNYSLPYTNRLYGVAVLSQENAWAVGYNNTGNPNTTFRVITMRYSDPCITPTPAATGTPSTPTPTVTGTPPTPTSTSTPTPTLPPAACPNQFTDVPPDSTFYPYVRCMACRGIISGYQCGGPGEPCAPYPYPYFRPNADVTRGQLAKIISNSAGFNEPLGSQTFQDVPEGSGFIDYVERLVCCNRNIISGYPCGTRPEEPCVPPENRPYFRPNNNATRGQISKMVSNAARFYDPPQGWAFQDVPPSHPFYEWIQRLASRGIMGGYNCGGPGEPCIGPENRPYFRPNNNATRGQISKIVANSFFPNCNTTLSDP